MKKITIFLLILCCGGCASFDIPKYIPDNHPYKKKFYASFDEVLRVTKRTLQDNGWKIESTSDPSIYERTKMVGSKPGRQIVIFTKIRQTSLVVGTSYARVNAFLWTGSDSSIELELRYVTVSSTPLKTFYNYRKDNVIESLLKQIEKRLQLG